MMHRTISTMSYVLAKLVRQGEGTFFVLSDVRI